MLRDAAIEGLNARIIRAAFRGSKGSTVCALRASKPFRSFPNDGSDESLFKACANYVWRMLCFDYVGCAPHNCHPVTADLDVSSFFYKKYGCSFHTDCGREEYRADWKGCIESLDLLIKQFEATIPVTMQAGAMSWARAYGIVQ
jgi:hypothetical protein